ncbi:MAG: hypothetical protein ACJAS4_001053 [Bacteriovoracaceae bacterium]
MLSLNLLIFKVFFLIILATIEVMRKSNLRNFLKNATLTCLIIVATACNAKAAKWGTVIVEKAKIFSDVEMTSVIGYIKKGKEIRVGEVPKNKARLLPIIVSNKIAYIQVKDIKTGADIKTLKSVSQRIRDKMSEKTGVGRIGIYGGTYYGFLLNNEFEDSIGNDLFFFDFGLRGYYTNLKTEKGFRVSVGHASAKKGDSQISVSSVGVSYNFSGIKYPDFNLNFYAGGILSPIVEYKEGNDFKINGQAFGGEIGAEMRFSLSDKLSLHVGGNYQLLKFVNMALPENNLYPEEFNPIVNGVKVIGALTYEY